MTRVVSVFLPNWSIDRFRRMAGDAAPQPEVPLVLIVRDGNRRLVQAANAAALAAGLHVGMPATKAQALLPGLLVEEADAGADAQELERLAIWLHQRVAPIVAPDPPHGIVIDTTGADHLHGGEGDMLDAIVGRLAMSGVEARAAIADSWGAAHALARYVSQSTVVTKVGHRAQPLIPLPLECLRLPAKISNDLRVLGFETAGDIIAQPRSPLTLRFGPEIARRLAQALGEIAEPIIAIRPLISSRFAAPSPNRSARRRQSLVTSASWLPSSAVASRHAVLGLDAWISSATALTADFRQSGLGSPNLSAT